VAQYRVMSNEEVSGVNFPRDLPPKFHFALKLSTHSAAIAIEMMHELLFGNLSILSLLLADITSDKASICLVVLMGCSVLDGTSVRKEPRCWKKDHQ
jgi:hypothetical protein